MIYNLICNIYIPNSTYIIITNNKYGGMTVLFKQKTKLSKGNTNSKSVRTSVPANIAQILNVKAGDSIEWIVESNSDNITITITKAE